MKRKADKTDWSIDAWHDRCAWCSVHIPEDHEVFGISIALKPEGLREVKPGTVEPMLLYKAGKRVPMMIVTDDSPAKQAGKDAFFQLCSEDCARNLQTAMREEMEG